MTEQNPTQRGHSGEPPRQTHNTERKAFIFYSNWYSDVSESLTEAQQGEFLLTVVRYATEGTLPDTRTTPVVASMFGLIRMAIDADLEKYEKMVQRNHKRTTNLQARCADNQDTSHKSPRIKNQESEIKNQPSSSEGNDKKQEARVREEEVKDYWAVRHFKSDCAEFIRYYEQRGWCNLNGEPLQSWKKAALRWEDKFIHDVLPARRRDARVEELAAREEKAAENARIRREDNRRQSEERDREAAAAVTREQGQYMFRRALTFCRGDQPAAINLLRQASADPRIFRQLSEGFCPPDNPSQNS